VTIDVDPLRAALPSGVVALDFDGTLAPISPRPGDARPLGGAESHLDGAAQVWAEATAARDPRRRGAVGDGATAALD
jgi:hypothetical protein